MKFEYQDAIDFIKQMGLYPQFVGFCTATPYIKSKRRKVYLFLIQKQKWQLFKTLPYSLNESIRVVKEKSYGL